MEIGLFFGSFNPIHIGHLIIAQHVLNEGDLKKIWFVLSPHNPTKKENSLLNVRHRLQLLQLALEYDAQFKPCDIELKMPQPSYTIHTLLKLKEKYPQHNFSIIMGSDSFCNLPNWKNGKYIIENYKIYVYQRKEHVVQNQRSNIIICQAPILDISASLIRKMIKEKKNLKYLLPENLIQKIEKEQYYY